MKKIQSTRYQAYLLRLWREGEQGSWRAVLQDAHSETQRGFASLQSLFDFLTEATGETNAPPGRQDTIILPKGEEK